jgi:hypothetical protein
LFSHAAERHRSAFLAGGGDSLSLQGQTAWAVPSGASLGAIQCFDVQALPATHEATQPVETSSVALAVADPAGSVSVAQGAPADLVQDPGNASRYFTRIAQISRSAGCRVARVRAVETHGPDGDGFPISSLTRQALGTKFYGGSCLEESLLAGWRRSRPALTRRNLSVAWNTWILTARHARCADAPQLVCTAPFAHSVMHAGGLREQAKFDGTHQ